jgi:hypothetical protein
VPPASAAAGSGILDDAAERFFGERSVSSLDRPQPASRSATRSRHTPGCQPAGRLARKCRVTIATRERSVLIDPNARSGLPRIVSPPLTLSRGHESAGGAERARGPGRRWKAAGAILHPKGGSVRERRSVLPGGGRVGFLRERSVMEPRNGKAGGGRGIVASLSVLIGSSPFRHLPQILILTTSILILLTYSLFKPILPTLLFHLLLTPLSFSPLISSSTTLPSTLLHITPTFNTLTSFPSKNSTLNLTPTPPPTPHSLNPPLPSPSYLSSLFSSSFLSFQHYFLLSLITPQHYLLFPLPLSPPFPNPPSQLSPSLLNNLHPPTSHNLFPSPLPPRFSSSPPLLPYFPLIPSLIPSPIPLIMNFPIWFHSFLLWCGVPPLYYLYAYCSHLSLFY